jgi:hypothetical protein
VIIGSFALGLPAAAPRWRLDGPAGPVIDALVGALINAGIPVQAITPGIAYRLDVPMTRTWSVVEDFAAKLQAADPAFSLVLERPPTDEVRVSQTVAPAYPYRRSVTVHGEGSAYSHVARAVDLGLDVVPVGDRRWQVSGRSSALVDWLALSWGKPTSEVLVALSLTAEEVDAEDKPPASISVDLPTRRTETEVMARDGQGQITKVVHVETSVTGGGMPSVSTS